MAMNQHGEQHRDLREEARNGKEVATLILLG
jgi:hypothetical protein